MENYPRFLNPCLPGLLGKSWSHCSGCVLPWVTAGSDWGTSFYWCGPLASELRTELLHFQCVLRRELLPSEWSPGRSPWLLGMLTWNSSLTTQTWDENFGSIGLPGRNWSHCLGSEVTASSIFLAMPIWKRTPSMLSWEEGTDGGVGTTHPCYVHQDLFDTLGMWLFICVGHCPEITVRNININSYWCWGSNSWPPRD